MGFWMPTDEQQRTNVSILAAAVVVACVVCIQAIVVVMPASPHLRAAASDLLLMLVACAATVMLAMAARASRHERAPGRQGWALLAAGQAIVFLGCIAWNARPTNASRYPAPALAEVLFAVAYPFLFLGVVRLPKEQPARGARLRTLVDVSTVMLAVGLMWWMLVLAPQIVREGANTTYLVAYALGYAFFDLGLAWAIAEGMTRKYAARDRLPALLLVAGFGVQILGDLALSFQLLNQGPISGALPDVLYAGNMALLGMAGWTRVVRSRTMPDDDEREPRPLITVPPQLSYFPYFGAVIAWVELIIGHDRTPLMGPTGLAIGTGLLTSLVLLRQWLARRALGTLSRELEQRVQARTAELTAEIAERKRTQEKLTVEIAERKRAQEDLLVYSTKLERSNHELQDFAYVASHDLQEPLRKIQAFGDRLRDRYGDALDEQGLDYLARMQNAASRMQSLIDGLLTYSRVTTKAQPFVPVDLRTVAAEVTADLEARIEESGATVELGDLPTIEADPLQMRQLLQNLMGNALKFRREGVPPVVRMSADWVPLPGAGGAETSSAPAFCLLHVADNGIGFDIKYLDRIFQVFQRLHGRGVYEGAGIGLAVCRKIAERHGGSITATSTPGSGSVFTVTLPAHHAHEG